jgi:hypothetical protein
MASLSNSGQRSGKLPVEDMTSLSRLAGFAMLIAGAAYVTLLIILADVSPGHLPQSGQNLLEYMVRRGLLMQVAMAVIVTAASVQIHATQLLR